MKSKIFATTNSWAPLSLRVLLGLVVFPHGAQKVFGWFGGYGFTGTMTFFTDTVGMPWLAGFAVIVLESLGALVLIAGAATRVVAALYVVLALGITFSTAIHHGFFMNWFGNQAGEGYEYFLLWTGMAVALVITGGGIYSVDGLVFRKSNESL